MDNLTTEEKFAVVKQSFIASLGDKQQAIATHWGTISDQWDNEEFQQLYRIIHGLAGSAETFDLPDITMQARTIQMHFKLLENDQVLDQQLKETISEQIDIMLNLLQNAK